MHKSQANNRIEILLVVFISLLLSAQPSREFPREIFLLFMDYNARSPRMTCRTMRRSSVPRCQPNIEHNNDSVLERYHYGCSQTLVSIEIGRRRFASEEKLKLLRTTAHGEVFY